MSKNRLNPDDWLAAGYKALAARGPVALKAEPLARDLGTTKGSFYWHFEDVPAFHKALLLAWEQAATEQLEKAQQGPETPIQRLRALGKIQDKMEPSMRSWARENALARKTLGRVDAAHMRYISDQLRAIGLTNAELAKILHGAQIGLQALSPNEKKANMAAIATLVDLILALYEEA